MLNADGVACPNDTPCIADSPSLVAIPSDARSRKSADSDGTCCPRSTLRRSARSDIRHRLLHHFVPLRPVRGLPLCAHCNFLQLRGHVSRIGGRRCAGTARCNRTRGLDCGAHSKTCSEEKWEKGLHRVSGSRFLEAYTALLDEWEKMLSKARSLVTWVDRKKSMKAT
jgi:hypothetical protein